MRNQSETKMHVKDISNKNPNWFILRKNINHVLEFERRAKKSCWNYSRFEYFFQATFFPSPEVVSQNVNFRKKVFGFVFLSPHLQIQY